MQITEKQKKYITYGVIGIAAIWLLSSFGSNPDSTTQGEDPTGNGGATPSGPEEFNAKKVADILHAAMNRKGTDELAIANALKRVSQTQFDKVVAAFGARPYNDLFGDDTSIPQNFSIAIPRPLPYWMKEELSDKELSTWRLKYPKYF